MIFRGVGPAPVLISGWVLVTIAAGVIAARVYLRLKIQRRRLMVGDMLMVAAWICGCVTTSQTVALSKYGALEKYVGSSLAGYKGDPKNIPSILKVFWLNLIPLHLTFYICKAALLSMYLQIFPVFMRKRRLVLWGVIVYTAFAFVATMISCIFICHPMSRLWDINSNAMCLPSTAQTIFIVTWTFNTAGELFCKSADLMNGERSKFISMTVFILPWLVLSGLNVRIFVKVGVYCTFLLGVATIASAVMRCVLVMRSRVGDAVPMSTTIFWGNLECNLGLVIACLPSLGPYFSLPKNSYRGGLNGQASSGTHRERPSNISAVVSRRPYIPDDDLISNDNRTVGGNSESDLVHGTPHQHEDFNMSTNINNHHS